LGTLEISRLAQKQAPARVAASASANRELAKKVISSGPAVSRAATPEIRFCGLAPDDTVAPVSLAISAMVSGAGAGKNSGSAIDTYRQTIRAVESPTAL
jgi:hypothetical protein